MSAAEKPVTLSLLVEGALRDQQDLSAVDRFAQRHETELRVLHSDRYEELIPIGRTPGEGQQLAFRVDLDRCTGCKACVSACHSLNGLREDETWRDVGLVIGEEAGVPIQQTVTTACHHCASPACLSGCPVKAYEKDPVTGIVRHLDDQCIGCQYCILKCPYDVPKYDATRGIVRKCDMCTDRLAEGEAPACVQGCPTSAISIEIVDVDERPAELLPTLGAALPDSDYTQPTTRYVTERSIDALAPAADDAVPVGDAHDPLALMLVLTQLSIGALAFDVAFGGGAIDGPRLARLALASGAAALGLGAATLHLGRPLYAFRAMLGWRTSWMSREILAFGAYVPAVIATTAVCALAMLATPLSPWAVTALPVLELATLGMGLVSLLCSVMIYVDTRRASWSFSRTARGFTMTALALGALASAVGGLGGPWLSLLGAAALGAMLLGEWREVARAPRAPKSDLARSMRLLRTQLAMRFRLRLAVGGAAAALAVAAAGLTAGGAEAAGTVAGLALLLAIASEFAGRHLFFTAEAARAMPGA